MLITKGFFGVPLSILNLEGHSVNTYCKSPHQSTQNFFSAISRAASTKSLV